MRPLQLFGKFTHTSESPPRFDPQRSDRHDPSERKPPSPSNLICQGVKATRGYSPACGIIREVDLQKHIDGGVIADLQSSHEGVSIDRVDYVSVATNLAGLLGLNLPHKVPASIKI